MPILWFFLLLIGIHERGEDSLKILRVFGIITFIGVIAGVIWSFVLCIAT